MWLGINPFALTKSHRHLRKLKQKDIPSVGPRSAIPFDRDTQRVCCALPLWMSRFRTASVAVFVETYCCITVNSLTASTFDALSVPTASVNWEVLGAFGDRSWTVPNTPNASHLLRMALSKPESGARGPPVLATCWHQVGVT
jgi:hypothetical protein